MLYHEAVGRRLGLSATDQRALSLVGREGPFTAGEPARRMGVTSGAATGLIDRLERGGHLRREADPGDRRRTLVRSTGNRRDTGPLQDLSRAMGAMMARYGPDELAAIGDYVRRTIDVLEEQTRRLGQEAATQ
ncbi:MarR family transcriptional regulator [Streptomyces sp. NPDC051561]|uniref:MarR family transcriptional regulator n=1 Tax=Streptomyces sp. NPDC051561 TaxID=3365658 RepID=UPI003798861D